MPYQDIIPAPVAQSTPAWRSGTRLQAAWQDLTKRLADAQEQLAAAHALIGVYQRSMHLPPAPAPFAAAVRDGARQVHMRMHDHKVVIGLPGEPRMADPVGEATAWRCPLRVHAAVCAEPAVPHAVGLRLAELPEGHRWQAWRTAGTTTMVVVNSRLPMTAARLALREALRIVRL